MDVGFLSSLRPRHWRWQSSLLPKIAAVAGAAVAEAQSVPHLSGRKSARRPRGAAIRAVLGLAGRLRNGSSRASGRRSAAKIDATLFGAAMADDLHARLTTDLRVETVRRGPIRRAAEATPSIDRRGTEVIAAATGVIAAAIGTTAL